MLDSTRLADAVGAHHGAQQTVLGVVAATLPVATPPPETWQLGSRENGTIPYEAGSPLTQLWAGMSVAMAVPVQLAPS